jgi:hypothetical protein
LNIVKWWPRIAQWKQAKYREMHLSEGSKKM